MIPRSDLEGLTPNLRGYARALTGNRNLADELVIECLHNLTRNSAPREAHDLRVRLFTHLHGLIIPTISGQPALGVRSPQIRGMRESGPLPDTQVADGRAPGLQLAFRALSTDQRAVLYLMAIEEFSDQEAAVITRMTVQAVRSVLRESLDRLSILPLSLVALKGMDSA